MFDSLNKKHLSPYGNDWVKTPNFDRLAEKTVAFENFYMGSTPCMPSRRELHTGRYNFLHRSWGPIEPFDDSMPELLKKSGVYTHLVTDHYHYFEEGGATYHGRYNSWELFRGQEGDPWKGVIGNVEIPEYEPTVAKKPSFRQNWINREYQKEEKDQSITKTFKSGMEFIKTNSLEDNWFLQLEVFDPHEPFLSPDSYNELYPHDYDGKTFDWPSYAPVAENEDVINHANCEYASLVSMCDANLGKVLDLMDEKDMWKDTMLIINTDHGFLLGEHQWWGKNIQPMFNEIANTPFFIWDPRNPQKNEKRLALAQTIDLAPTLLEFFNVEIPGDMQGRPLTPAIIDDSPIRQTALFGIHGGHVNITDGKRTYMRGPVTPENGELYEYTLMPTNMRSFMNAKQLQNAEFTEGFSFTKNMKVLRMPPGMSMSMFRFGHRLYDIEEDWDEMNRLDDRELELEMIEKLRLAMIESEAPAEQFSRLGIQADKAMTKEQLLMQQEESVQFNDPGLGNDMEYSENAKTQVLFLLDMIPSDFKPQFLMMLKSQAVEGKIDSKLVIRSAGMVLQDFGNMKDYFLHLLSNIHRGLD